MADSTDVVCRPLCCYAGSHSFVLLATNLAGGTSFAVGEILEIEGVSIVAVRKGGGIWQRDFWDIQLRRGDNYDQKWHYVLHNPVRAGLIKDAKRWPYQGEIERLEW